MFEVFIRALQGIAGLFILGLILDWPEQKRKQKQNCIAGKHKYGDWKDQYEIHNGNDVWERKCKNCPKTEVTVSKLTPQK